MKLHWHDSLSRNVNYYFDCQTDEDFRDFVEKVPKSCRITIVSDSCHSGGLIESAKEQIGESTKEGGQNSSPGFKNFLHRAVDTEIPTELCHQYKSDIGEKDVELHHVNHRYVKNRALPLSTLIDILKQKTGKDDIEIGKLRPTLFDIFGEDASPKVKNFVVGILGLVNNLAQGLFEYKLHDSDEEYENPVKSAPETYATSTKRSIVDGGILLSGCQTNQTSADASPNGNSEEAYGAFSNAIQAIIAEKDGVVTNREVILKARKKLHRQGYSQKPGLYCSDNHVDAPFIC